MFHKLFKLIFSLILILAFVFGTFQEILRYCRRETGTVVSHPKEQNKDFPTISICIYPPISYTLQKQLKEKNLNFRKMNINNNYDMMQLYLTQVKPNLTKEQFKEQLDTIWLGTDDIIQDIFAIDEEGRRVSILEIGEQNKVSVSLGDCPTFKLPVNLTKSKKIEIQLKKLQLSVPGTWKIFLYQTGWFYLTFDDLDFLQVHDGDDTEVFVNIQQQVKIPIEDLFEYTVPESTTDCEANETFSFDQKITRTIHREMNATFSCTFPFNGGLDSHHNYSICNDPALYDTKYIYPVWMDVVNNELKSCTKSVISYGPLHVHNISRGTLMPAPQPGTGARVIVRLPDNITRNVEYVKVDIISLLGSIGGYLGLYLGVSLWQLMDVLPVIAGLFKQAAGTTKKNKNAKHFRLHSE